MGLVSCGMVGFDFEKARTALKVPKAYAVAMFALRRPGDRASLPDEMRESEVPSGRRPVRESIRDDVFAFMEAKA